MRKKLLAYGLPPLALILLFFLAHERSSPSTGEIPSVDIPIIGRAIQLVEKNYVDPDLVDPRKILQEALQPLEGSISPFMVRLEERKLSLRFGDILGEISFSPHLTLEELTSILRKTLGFLRATYHGRLDLKEREYLTVNGLVSGLDPHSNFLSPPVYKEFKIGTRGNFGGLGIVIGIRDGHLTVIAPLEETPAWKAGLKPKDRIIQIDDASTINMSLTEAVEKLRGPVGSNVTVIVQREGISAPRKYEIRRALIHIQSVAGRFLEGGRIGLIKIKNFQEDTLEAFDQVMKSFRKKGNEPAGLILDLRNNPGGLLDQATELADRFLANGVIVKTVGSQNTEVKKARPGDPEESLPIVVLVNEGSASASEIVAGALQYTNRALILGNLTFGKGTVQTIFDLKDGSALKLTVAKYLTGDDREVQSIGIMPDIELMPLTVQKEAVNLFEDMTKREGELKKPTRGLPPLQIQYLAATEEKGEEEDESYRIPLENDFPILFAKEILELPRSGGMDREAWMEAIAPLAKKANQVQATLIEESLKKIGIDWTYGIPRGRPSLEVTATIRDEKGKVVGSLSPGDKGSLQVEVENRGTGTAFRLAALTQSDDPLFNNLEFPLGRIEPGEKRSWGTPLEIPSLAPPRREPVMFNLREAQGRTPPPKEVTVVVQEKLTPFFAYSYRIRDGQDPDTHGNQNGRPEPGEVIALNIQMKNEGRGGSPEPVVNLKNLGGSEIFIRQGRATLKSLPPQGQADVRLIFQIGKKIPSETEKFSLELSIRDQKMGEELVDELNFPLKGEEAVSPPQGVWQKPPRFEIPNPPLEALQPSYAIRGIVLDDQRVEHLFIFVGSTKEVYLAPRGIDPRYFPFETKVSLKEGMNLITVAAQDDRELTTRKQWIVWRKK